MSKKPISRLLLLLCSAPVLAAAVAACSPAAGISIGPQPAEVMISSGNSEVNGMELTVIGDVKNGNWGGSGINMLVEKSSATIEFDCASATISSRIKTAKDGKFVASGMMTQSGPGPIRLGGEPKARAVRFEGKITGKQMKMTVAFEATGELIGTYVLEEGRSGRIRRCL